MEEPHIHCMKCVNRRCMTRLESGVSCDLIGCSLICGAVFHSCKLAEHRLLCPLEKVPCPNHNFGCPFKVTRNKIAGHLTVCPASVVCCTMEWNRWPVSYTDRKSYENLSKDVGDVEQLDMALALQDQRMLLESLRVATKVSKEAEKQNCCLEKPVITPAEAEISSGIITVDEESYSKLYQATVETSKSIAAAFDILSNATKEMGFSSGVEDRNGATGGSDQETIGMKEGDVESDSEFGAVGGEVHSDRSRNGIVKFWQDGVVSDLPSVAALVHVRQDQMDNVADESKQPTRTGNLSHEVRHLGDHLPLPYHSLPVEARDLPGSSPALSVPLPLLVPNNVIQNEFEDRWLEHSFQNLQVLRGMSLFTFNGRRAMFTSGHSAYVKMVDKSVDTSDLEVEDDPMGLHGIDLITAALLFCLGDSPGGRSISDSRFVDGYRIDFGTQTFSFPSAILATNTMVGDIASASACDHANPQLSNPSPFHTLRLDLVLECVARYQTKQRSMFTFVCGQIFRRDEFASHFRNVHGDIHAGLNGWMEQRCPLAYYGCTYSQRRFCPSMQGSRIVHDRHLRAFGVQPSVVAPPTDHQPCHHLTTLPFEILQHVASFLDGFSLCQLSRVSRLMRDVCASLLQERGMVVLLWENQRDDKGRSCWQIKDKVWQFSTAFSTVNEWKFADIASMSDHLKTCQFNTVQQSGEPVPLPCMYSTRLLTREGRSMHSVLRPIL